MSDTDELVEKMNNIYKQQKKLAEERNNLIKGTDITWSFEKCRKLKCKHIKGCKNNCGARGVIWYCIHDWCLPYQDIVSVKDLYKKEEKTEEPVVMTGIKYLVGGYGINKDRINVVIKETPKYYKLNNGDRIRKDTMCTDMATSAFQDFNYHVRVATEEEIKNFLDKNIKF